MTKRSETSPEGLDAFVREEALARFLRYVQVNTQSDPRSGTHPSSPGQLALGRMLKGELEQLGPTAVEQNAHGYVYATLPARAGCKGPSITFCSHLDTSPSVSGAEVKPVLHHNYDGGTIRFPADPELTLSPADSPELLDFKQDTIITASGDTLLGADDKAGVAEIMAALAALQRFTELPHPELRIVFTPDEEIGQGADHIDLNLLGTYGYTVDGGRLGELEDECFDAYEVKLVFKGANVHPGYAKNRMVNAAAAAARFMAALPEYETPEHTEQREGFYHLSGMQGDESQAVLSLILRDFNHHGNQKRLALLQHLQRLFEARCQGLRIEMTTKEQYRNMKSVLEQHPLVLHKARAAMRMAGVEVIAKAIRGGTDGARLSFMGMPTPNIFAGGLLFHSKKEWVPVIALQKAAEVILHLCNLWARGA